MHLVNTPHVSLEMWVMESLLGEGRGEVVLNVYDLLGRLVLDLSDEANQKSEIVIRNSQLPRAGMYFYQLRIGSEVQTKKMVLMKAE